MRLVRGAWKILVGVKDALVLALLLLFFGLLFAALNAMPNRAIVPGALVLKLNGPIVEQPTELSPFAALGGGGTLREYRLRDVLRALEAARTDQRVKAVVLDLEGFGGGYPATLIEVGQAIRAVRASGKPVLAYAPEYGDSAYMLAANAGEVWLDPMGAVLPRGFGGSNLYFKGLLDRLGVNARVYRVGTYKAAVEPFTRTDQSPEAREANQALYATIFDAWRAELRTARPKANIEQAYRDPQAFMRAGGGDAARASQIAGAVDRLGDRIAFGRRVAEIAGADPKGRDGQFAAIRYPNWIAVNPVRTTGPAIGVLTIAGTIVDGQAPAGTAGGDTVTRALLTGIADNDLKALVVRVDSGGGSAFASERMRQAILAAKAKGLPIVVSMGGVAASGGYWVATPADVIFAEPTTITGSIGVFGLIPTFENALAKIGVTTDGVRTTPLAGQPDVLAGTTPEADAMIQAGVEDIYAKFIARVSEARRMPPARVDRIAQGRVWVGSTARQLGLVDRFGGMGDAIAEAARRARLDPAAVRAVYLERQPGWEARLAEAFPRDEDRTGGEAGARGMIGLVAADQRAMLNRALADARMLLTNGGGVQARCLECAGYGPARGGRGAEASVLELIVARFGL